MITIFTGPMFSGKSTLLIELYSTIWDKESVLCFKPAKDTRTKTNLRARNVKQQPNAIVINKFADIVKYYNPNIKIILIDEAQFIEGDYMILSDYSISKDINIYISGLNQNSNQEPFGSMPNLLAIADNIILLKADCECGNTAEYTYCLEHKTSEILIGDKEYIPLCRKCLLKYRNGGKNDNS